MSPRVSVVIPSYRRPEQLRSALDGVRLQGRRPDEIVVVHRTDDLETAGSIAGAPDVTAVTVTEPGVLAAMNAGVAASTGEVVAFLDDDAVPRPGWLAGLLEHLGDPEVGGVGGRDVVHTLPDPDLVNTGPVGLITPWGKLVGNHHLGSGPARDVQVLKAVNMAFRREALALPRSLRGSGAQVHFEVATCLWAISRGWRLRYDPAVVVDHYPGPRFDADRREGPDPVAAEDAAYNLVAGLLTFRPDLRWRRALYGCAVGDAMTPGLLRAARSLLAHEPAVGTRLVASWRGQTAALADVRVRRLVDMQPASSP